MGLHMGVSQYFSYIIPNKDPRNPYIIPIYPQGSLGYPLLRDSHIRCWDAGSQLGSWHTDSFSGISSKLFDRIPKGPGLKGFRV